MFRPIITASLAVALLAGLTGTASAQDRPTAPPSDGTVGDRVWEKLDTNGDGAIDGLELDDAKRRVTDRMQQAFDAADADHDGRVTRDEARDHARAKLAELRDRIRERLEQRRAERGDRRR